MSFDWILQARTDSIWREKICTELNSNTVNTITYQGMYRLTFNPDEKYVYVTAFSKNSEFYWKIPSKKISYDAVMNILNGNWDAIKKTDIINIME